MKQHTDWVKGRIQNVPNLVTKTFVSLAPRAGGVLPAPPYAVLHPSDGNDSVERLHGPALTQHPRFTLRIVGTSYDSIAAVARNVKAQFVVGGFGVTPEIDGELCSRVWWHAPEPAEPDHDVTPAIVSGVYEIGFTSDPVAV